jgi:hypothetical protein
MILYAMKKASLMEEWVSVGFVQKRKDRILVAAGLDTPLSGCGTMMFADYKMLRLLDDRSELLKIFR